LIGHRPVFPAYNKSFGGLRFLPDTRRHPLSRRIGESLLSMNAPTFEKPGVA